MKREAKGGGVLGRQAGLAWATVTAMILALFGEGVRWWRPACGGGDGRAGEAIGFPLPYARPTLVSSGEYFFMPHMLLLNGILLALLLFPVFRLVARRLGPRTRSAATIVALLAATPVAALWALLFSVFVPVVSIEDSLFDADVLGYRPAFIAEALGLPSCD
ncbi:hypothetical protein [Caulobacter mirabilis]|nr:hypothetical protein [Caulobacter mirabilis]